MKPLKYCHFCLRLLWANDFARCNSLNDNERICESCRVKWGVGTLEELFEFIHAEALKRESNFA